LDELPQPLKLYTTHLAYTMNRNTVNDCANINMDAYNMNYDVVYSCHTEETISVFTMMQYLLSQSSLNVFTQHPSFQIRTINFDFT